MDAFNLPRPLALFDPAGHSVGSGPFGGPDQLSTTAGDENLSPTSGQLAPLDPLQRRTDEQYLDDLVRVVHHDRDPSVLWQDDLCVVRTEHFWLRRDGRRIELSHSLQAHQLDNDVAGWLISELFEPGWLSSSDIFERTFTGIVCSTLDDPLLAWQAFYHNTLAKIRQWGAGASATEQPSLISDMAPVYARAVQSVPAGTVLDLGSCFGFLPLLLAERGENRIIASDIVSGCMRLLTSIADSMSLTLETLSCDASAVPLPDAAVDTVTVVHLLEHLEPDHGNAVLAEALRLASGRVVVAVPFEEEPNVCFGHRRQFDTTTLANLGKSTGKPFTVSEYHGGWLIVDARW